MRITRSICLAFATTAAFVGVGVMPAHGATATWKVQPTPAPAGSTDSVLSGVSCTSTSFCMAVGHVGGNAGGPGVTLAERWDGSAWSITKTPNPTGATTSFLSGVSCTGPTWCSAVGQAIFSTSTSVRVNALIEAWNGTKWTIQRAAPPAGPGAFVGLSSISCVSPTSCEAVGGFLRSGVTAQDQPLAEVWNGTAWAVQPTPNPHAENGSALDGLSCSSANACTAGGNFAFADVNQSVFAFRWNGTAWTQQSQPNPAGQGYNQENGMSCASATSCVGVGSWTDNNGNPQTLIENWDGSMWTRMGARHPAGSVTTMLGGVSCTSPTTCMAVGSWGNSTVGSQFPLAENRVGSIWMAQEPPLPAGAGSASLADVSCLGAMHCVAVGSSVSGSTVSPLAELYSM